MEVGEEGDDIHCHHQNDSCIKVSSDECHFNVSSIVRDKVTRQCPQTTTFSKRREISEVVANRGPSAYQPNALPLGQTGSQKRPRQPCSRYAPQSPSAEEYAPWFSGVAEEVRFLKQQRRRG